MMDYTKLTDEQLNQHSVAAHQEQERRNSMRNIPQEILILAKTYENHGGDKSELANAINDLPL